jgi:DNA-binding transcriptional ArsR family regulator
MIGLVNERAHLPLFRSVAQERILAALFEHHDVELSIGELAMVTGVPQPTVSHEVNRLLAGATVSVRRLGRSRLVSANWDLPWAEHIAAIMAQTVGVPHKIATTLAQVATVERAFLFGSWAARHLGHDGPPPQDLDLLVVGDVDWLALSSALRPLEPDLRLDVNPVVISSAGWDGRRTDPFLSTVIERPLVELDLDGTRRRRTACRG